MTHGDVYHIDQKTVPGLRFEWHPKIRRVYVIRTDRSPHVAEPIRDDVGTHGDAMMTVLIWLRGYMAATSWREPDIRQTSEHVNGSRVILGV